MQDLNRLISTDAGWVLTAASDSNEAGQIVGRGFLTGKQEYHAFLLTPRLQVWQPTSRDQRLTGDPSR
jgi:hypothetical protein